jgi:glucose/arabinose dehydrogenase
MAVEEGRAAIWEIDRAHRQAPDLRLGPAQPERHGVDRGPGGAPVLWTVANERDEIGSDLVPDYLTSVKDGAFYGWPYSYYGQTSTRGCSRPTWSSSPRRSRPTTPSAPHTASLGLASAEGAKLPGAVHERRLRRPARLVEPAARTAATR